MIIIYTLPICPNCDELKLKLKNNDVKFITKDLEDDDVRIELLMDSVTLVEAPIVNINGVYYNKDDALKEMGLC
jgi:glutaredoxin